MIEFKGKQYRKLDVYDLFEFIETSKPGEYMQYFDKYVFRTETEVFAAYVDDLENCWKI